MIENKNNFSNEVKYIVKRNGYRVSTEDYSTYDEAVEEKEHWEEIIRKWPDGSVISIEPVPTLSTKN